MTIAERTQLVESLTFELRVAFVAFCVERSLKEARLHPVSASQLQQIPEMEKGLALLWARAEKSVEASSKELNRIIGVLAGFESPMPDGENLKYNYDITLVEAARVLTKGLSVLLDPEKATPRFIAGSTSGPYLIVAQVYDDYQGARAGEMAVAEAALQRLKALEGKPFSRSLFDGISDWPRGPLSKKYAENRLKGTATSEDE